MKEEFETSSTAISAFMSASDCIGPDLVVPSLRVCPSLFCAARGIGQSTPYCPKPGSEGLLTESHHRMRAAAKTAHKPSLFPAGRADRKASKIFPL